MTNSEIITSANQVLRNKITSLLVSKMKVENLSFGCQVSNGITILFGKVHTYIQHNGKLYKGIA